MKTLFRLFFVFIALSFSTFAQATETQSNNAFTPEQKTQIQTIVREYFLKNPQLLVEMVGKLQEQTDKKNENKIQKVLINNGNALLNAPNTPILGNPKGTVTLVEFFDYQCSYCKRAATMLNQLAQDNKNLRIVMKEWPVFGASSDFAARAALAAQQQGKYLQFHQTLMQSKQRLTDQVVLNTAKSVGLDLTKLQTDMNSKPIVSELKSNMMLAKALQLAGTPVFIITTSDGKQNKAIFIPGAADLESLQNAIKKVG